MTDLLMEYIPTVGFALIGVIIVVHLIVVSYLCLKRNNAPVETARAVAYYKDPQMRSTLFGRSNTYNFYITFHTENGEVLELYMCRDPYFSIPEGAWGELTWQQDKFWKFVLEDGTEVM